MWKMSRKILFIIFNEEELGVLNGQTPGLKWQEYFSRLSMENLLLCIALVAKNINAFRN